MANSGTGGQPEAPRQCTHSGEHSDLLSVYNFTHFLPDDCGVYVVAYFLCFVELALPVLRIT